MKHSLCHIIFSLLFLCISAYSLQAQTPVAGFYMTELDEVPKNSGCSPQIVAFVDTSTINGNPIPYRTQNTHGFNSHFWIFGDNRIPTSTSNKKDPIFGYLYPGQYTITLIVTHNGVNYDTTQQTFTVFSQPVVGMYGVPTKGCNPLLVNFTDTSYTVGDSIVEWLWDFGDGITAYAKDTFHTYALFPGAPRCFSVTLTVTTSNGCVESKTFPDYVCIDPPPVADFRGDTLLCSRPFELTFENLSFTDSDNTLAYEWDFGDGSPISNDINPTHTYHPDSIKCYTVKLKVTDTDCNEMDSIIKVNYVCTNDFDAEFELDTNATCARTSVKFTNLTIGSASSYFWNFGDASNSTSTKTNPTHLYNTPGTYDVMLIATDNTGCADTLIKDDIITVFPLPTAEFLADTSYSCTPPLTVNFTDNSSPNITRREWDFGDGDSSSAINPTHIYTTAGTHNVELTVYDAQGCQSTFSSPIVIDGITAAFSMDTFKGCAPLHVDFTDESDDPRSEIEYWTWDFGHMGQGSSLKDPSFTYTTPGTYTVTLTVEDQTGSCISTTEDFVFVGSLGTPNFLPDSFMVCVDQELGFTNLTNTTNADLECFWDFNGDGSIDATGCDNQTYAFEQPGTYCASLTVGFNECEADTCIEIIVMEPRADFDFERNCINPDSIKFIDMSSGASTWKWYFGDGDSLVDQQHPEIQNPSHEYDMAGQYTVTLVVSNDTTPCTSSMEKQVNLESTIADFDTLSFYPACAGDTVYFSDESQGNIQSYSWNFGDPQSGANNTSSNANPSHVYNNVGVYDVSLTIIDNNGCSRTITKNSLIATSLVTADFEVGTYDPCLSKVPGSSVTVGFTDQSSSSTGIINNWQWSFGASTPNATNTFTTPGKKTIKLTVENDMGCIDIHTENIEIAQPNADFELEYSIYCVNNPVPFVNNSTGKGLEYLWSFGDENSSTSRNPVHFYDSASTYNVTLYIEDMFGCKDSITRLNALSTSSPFICFESEDTVSRCPPHTARFENCSEFDSTIGVKSIIWDFGDGSFSPFPNPSHTYNKAGFFTVKVTIEYENYCVDSASYEQYISIGGATGDITMDPDTGCSPLEVCLNANSQGAISHFWLFFGGDCIDPQFILGEDTICQTYCEPGIWRPAVALTDTQSPPCRYVLFADDPIIVDTVYGSFMTDVDTVCRDLPVLFTDSSYSVVDTAYSTWTFIWDFGDGTIDSSNTDSLVHVYDSMGTYTVSLTVINNFGCSSITSKEIFVRDRPTAGFTVSDTSGCDELNVIFVDSSKSGFGAIITDWYWDFGDTTTAADTSHVIDTATYNYQLVGGYIPALIVTDEYGCNDTARTPINIYRSPLGILNSDTVDICLKDTLQLMGDTGFVSYDWSPGWYLTDSTIYNPKASPPDTISYTLFIEESHGCHTTDTILVNVIPLPPLSVTPHADTAICLGDTIQLLAVGGADHHWLPAKWLSNSQSPDPLAWPQESTCYTAINLDTLTGCRNRDTVCIKVNVFTPYFIGERQCLGSVTDFLDYSESSEFPIVSWHWDFGVDTSARDTSVLENPSFLYPDSGSYQVELTVRDSLGCEGATTRTVRVDHPLTVYADTDATICLGDSIQLFSGDGDSVYWTPDRYIDNRFTFNPVVSPLFTTEYIAHISNGVCPFKTASVLIEVIQTPEVSTIDNTVILQGSRIELTTFTSSIDSVFWSPPDSLSCIFCESPVANPVKRTTYYVQVFDEYGCTNRDTVVIGVEVKCDKEQIFVPNIFTPNGDMVNDYVYARLRGLKQLNYFRIFDRWGKLVFETDDETIGWNGLDLNNKQLNSGVYVYAVEAECYFQNTIVKSGNITLIK